MNLFYKDYYSRKLRSECNGLGFFLFISSIAMSFVTVIIMLFVEILKGNVQDTSVTFLMSSITSIVCIFITSLFYCKFTQTSIAETIAMRKVKGSLMLPLIFFGFSATFISNYLGSLFYEAVALFGLKTDLSMEFQSLNPLEIFLYVLSISVIPALTEEFAFRGVVLGKLRKYGDSYAVLISALLFGLMHGNIIQIPFAFMVGLALGFLVIKSNSLLPGIIVHFLNNFMSVLFSVLIDNKVLSEDILNAIYGLIMLIAIALGIISVAILSKNKKFFKATSDNSILTFKEKTAACFTSVGIIFFTVYVILNTIIYVVEYYTNGAT